MPHIDQPTSTYTNLEGRASGMAGPQRARPPARGGGERDAASLSPPYPTAVLAQVSPRQPRHMLDLDELADVIHEGIVEAQRGRGASETCTWWDVAEATTLLLQHIAAVTSDEQAA